MNSKDSTGRTISFWFSHEEISALADKASELKVTRNEAARRAVRQFLGRSSVAER